ncbi:hypothetical protein LEP1GSC073_1283 [Leptospira noguchii str. Cascata]|nr:hypothetical protein LEP1GSC073_1283 [Leptospira noguchii str. Cascata]
MIHFAEKNWGLNFTDRFLKCGSYHKPRFYEQILNVETYTFKFFFISLRPTHVSYCSFFYKLIFVLCYDKDA